MIYGVQFHLPPLHFNLFLPSFPFLNQPVMSGHGPASPGLACFSFSVFFSFSHLIEI